MTTEITTPDLDTIERTIAGMASQAHSQEDAAVEHLRATVLAQAITTAKAALTALDTLIRERGQELSRAQAILGNAALDTIENIAEPLKWARHSASNASASVTGRGTLAWWIDQATRFHAASLPGLGPQQAATVIVARLREQAQHVPALARTLDDLRSNLAAIAQRAGHPLTVEGHVTLPPVPPRPGQHVRSDFDPLGRP